MKTSQQNQANQMKSQPSYARVRTAAYGAMAALTLMGAVQAQGIEIDISNARPEVIGNTLSIKRLVVPGFAGVWDADFEWDGAGAFRFKSAAPCASCDTGAPPTVTPPPSTNVIRSCQIRTNTGLVFDIAVFSDRLDFAVTPVENTYYFYPDMYQLVQAGNAAAIESNDYLVPASGGFYWLGVNGFTGSTIPLGVTKRGSVKWIGPWFTPHQSFSLAAIGLNPTPC